MTMAIPSALGKRKEREDDEASSPACTFQARVILENHWATGSVEIDYSAATTLHKFFDALQQVCAVAKRPSILAQPFAAPKFLLQETSTKSQGLRAMKYVTSRWNNPLSYHNWFERNVRQGDAMVLKVEVHMRTFGCAEREARQEMELVNSWYSNSYVPFKPQPVNRGAHLWVVAPVDDDGMELEDIRAIVDAPSTAEWFPDRVVKEREEVKEPAAAEQSPKQVKEEVGAPVKAEESSNVKDEDVEEDLFIMATPEEEAELEAERLRDPEAFDKKYLVDIDSEF